MKKIGFADHRYRHQRNSSFHGIRLSQPLFLFVTITVSLQSASSGKHRAYSRDEPEKCRREKRISDATVIYQARGQLHAGRKFVNYRHRVSYVVNDL